jgi:asparagine synthase (glutamine-hydrolysing)
MSAFVAAIDLDGQPQHEDIAARAIPHLHPTCDGHETWQDGAIAVARSRFRVSPEDRFEERFCRVDGADAVVCIADARLDNRDELFAQLRDSIHADAPSDTELIAAAFLRWNDGCVAHLLGDFAFAIWDRRDGRVFAASDPLALRTIRYAIAGRQLVLGSRTTAVAACLNSPPAVNARLLRDHIHGERTWWAQQTSYEGVHRVPAAHAVSIDARSVRRVRYCHVGEWPADTFRRDEEYFERFRELLTVSTRARLRCASPVGISLSGGLDSSSIACVAHHLLVAGGVPPVRTYSAVFHDSPRADERRFLEAVLRASPALLSRCEAMDDCWWYKGIAADDSYHLDEVEASGGRVMERRIAGLAAADGCRVMLSGHWSDQLLTGPYGSWAGLADLPLVRWPKELRYFRDAPGSTTMLIARALAHRIRPMGYRRNNGNLPFAPLSTGTHLSRRAYWAVLAGYQQFRRANLTTIGDNSGVEWRFPFLDRRLVEFMLKLPTNLRFRNGWSKFILREGLRGLLPDVIRERTYPTAFRDLTLRGIRNEGDRMRMLLRGSRVVERGWITRAAVEARLRECTLRPRYDAFESVSVWLCAEEWLRRPRP